MRELLSFDTTNLQGGLTPIEAKIELRRAYDANYNLDTGLTGVEICETEDILTGSLYEYWAMTFDKYKIGDRFNLSFDEYINRPSALIESLNRAAERMNAKDANILNKVGSDLGLGQAKK